MPYKINTSLTFAHFFPVVFQVHELGFDTGETLKMRWGTASRNEWGERFRFTVYDGTEYPMPNQLRLEWIAIAERKIYGLDTPLDSQLMEQLWQQTDEEDYHIYTHISCSVAPCGGVALWLHGPRRQTLVGWFKGKETEGTKKLPFNLTINKFCYDYINGSDPELGKHLREDEVPDAIVYDRMMQQHCYRIRPLLKKWNKENNQWIDYDAEKEGDKMPTVETLEVKCHDGTYDRMHDGYLERFHEAGLPRRITVNWNVGKRLYTAYFFITNVEKMTNLLRRITMMSLEGKVDFLLQMDPEQERFVLSLKNDELPEPVELGNDTVDVMVFRNRLECYRNPGYSQPKGAWRW